MRKNFASKSPTNVADVRNRMQNAAQQRMQEKLAGNSGKQKPPMPPITSNDAPSGMNPSKIPDKTKRAFNSKFAGK